VQSRIVLCREDRSHENREHPLERLHGFLLSYPRLATVDSKAVFPWPSAGVKPTGSDRLREVLPLQRTQRSR
jgi:hypothetical protein